MGLIPQTFIDELLARADIVEVIGSRVQLKKAGREYKACCPFHNEKSASFSVSTEKQFYHCFGCGAHGTVVRFLMEHDHLSFPEAVEELASRLGLEVPREADSSAPRRMDDGLFELMARVAEFFSEQLAREPRARNYAERRGLTSQTIAQFGIGYAPDSWNALLRRFGENDAARRALAEVGLIIERERSQLREAPAGENRYYDRFRDRLMFPIRDGRGRVIAFGGRILEQGEPKYLNSPESVLFHKGRELYGLFEVRRSSSSLKRVLVVEGYMDAVRLHQSGITSAVATLGTATTAEHFKRIFRLVSDVVFAFDGDRAGRAAAWRALQQALPEIRPGREVRFLFLPEGQDPDSLVGAEGRAAFEQRLEHTLPLSDYLMRELTEQSGTLDKAGRARFSQLAAPLLAKVPDSVYRDLLLEQVARVVGVGRERLLEDWRNTASQHAATNGHVTGSGSTGRTPASASVEARSGAAPARLSVGRGSLVRQCILRLLTFPAIALEVSAQERAALEDCDEAGAELLRELIDHLRAQPARSSAQIIERWAGRPEAAVLERLLQQEQLLADTLSAAGELHAALGKLRDLITVRRLQALEAKDAAVGLEPDERQEYLMLMSNRSAGGRPAR
ncbi:MAG: DNA primase [Sinobacteraceae bacterium]|nr:DNA primase [Nevskiaceae bacterium]